MASILAIVAVGYLYAIFATWVHLSVIGDVTAFGVDLAMPLIVTVVVTIVGTLISLRGLRSWVTVLIAWFASWWLLVGLAAIATSGVSADLLSRLAKTAAGQVISSGVWQFGHVLKMAAGAAGLPSGASAVQGDAAVSSTGFGAGPTIVLITSGLALAWSIVGTAVLARSRNSWNPRGFR